MRNRSILFRYLDWVNPVVYQVPLSYTTPMSIAVFVGGCMYQVFLTLDAFRIKNNIQLFAQCVCNVCLSISSIMQYHQIHEATRRVAAGHDMYNTPFAKLDQKFWAHTAPVLIVCTVVVVCCSVAMCYLAYKLHREFAWALYKDISADVNIRSRCLCYQIYLVLMKLTFYFLVAFVLVYAFVDVHYAQPEFALTIALIPAALIHLLLSVYYTRTEAHLGTTFTVLIHASLLAYLSTGIAVLTGTGLLARTTMKDEMLLFAFAALFFGAATLAAAAQCWANFGRGLRPILLGQTQPKGPGAGADEEDEERAYYFQRLNYAPPSAVDVLSSRRFALD